MTTRLAPRQRRCFARIPIARSHLPRGLCGVAVLHGQIKQIGPWASSKTMTAPSGRARTAVRIGSASASPHPCSTTTTGPRHTPTACSIRPCRPTASRFPLCQASEPRLSTCTRTSAVDILMLQSRPTLYRRDDELARPTHRGHHASPVPVVSMLHPALVALARAARSDSPVKVPWMLLHPRPCSWFSQYAWIVYAPSQPIRTASLRHRRRAHDRVQRRTPHASALAGAPSPVRA